MKYIKFTVKPNIGNKEYEVVRRYLNDERRPPLNYTWHTSKGDIVSTPSSQRERRNYVRRGLTGYEDIVEALR